MFTQRRALGLQSGVSDPLQILETCPTLLAIKPNSSSLQCSHIAFEIEAHIGISFTKLVEIFIP